MNVRGMRGWNPGSLRALNNHKIKPAWPPTCVTGISSVNQVVPQGQHMPEIRIAQTSDAWRESRQA